MVSTLTIRKVISLMGCFRVFIGAGISRPFAIKACIYRPLQLERVRFPYSLLFALLLAFGWQLRELGLFRGVAQHGCTRDLLPAVYAFHDEAVKSRLYFL